MRTIAGDPPRPTSVGSALVTMAMEEAVTVGGARGLEFSRLVLEGISRLRSRSTLPSRVERAIGMAAVVEDNNTMAGTRRWQQ